MFQLVLPELAADGINVIHRAILPLDFDVVSNMASTTALTNVPVWEGAYDGLLYLQRVAFEMDMQVDFTTDNLLVKAYERFSFGYFDPRAVWGSFPTI